MEELLVNQVPSFPEAQILEEGGPYNDSCLRAMELEAQTPIFKGSKLSRFLAILLLLNLQIRHQITNTAMSEIFQLLLTISYQMSWSQSFSKLLKCPCRGSESPKSRGFRLHYNTCMSKPLYFVCNEHEHAQECPICNEAACG